MCTTSSPLGRSMPKPSAGSYNTDFAPGRPGPCTCCCSENSALIIAIYLGKPESRVPTSSPACHINPRTGAWHLPTSFLGASTTTCSWTCSSGGSPSAVCPKPTRSCKRSSITTRRRRRYGVTASCSWRIGTRMIRANSSARAIRWRHLPVRLGWKTSRCITMKIPRPSPMPQLEKSFGRSTRGGWWSILSGTAARRP